jgi:hypothetical protein
VKYLPCNLHAPELNEHRVSDDKILFWWIIILIAVRFWLVNTMDLIATRTPHDDYLFISLAKNILSGQWLGPYNHYTLIKGPGYPLFIAVVHHLGLPLLIAQQLLYSLFSILVVIALRPLVTGRWLLMAVFALVLLNPFMFMYSGISRVMRLGLSMPLVLATFTCMFGLVSRVRGSWKSKIMWSSGLGFFFSYLWFTREEGIWMVPSLALTLLLFLLADAIYSKKELCLRILVIGWIGVIFWGLQTTFAFLNEKHYGQPVINELKSAQFSSALGSLMNIDIGDIRRKVPVSSEAQQLAYSVSPTFALLKPVFEKNKSGAWPASFYIWTLRNAAAHGGHIDTLSDALEFYGKIGSEIQQACESGKIPCFNRKPTLRPPWHAAYNQDIWPVFSGIFTDAVTFSRFDEDEMKVDARISYGPKEIMEDYMFITREHLVPSRRSVLNSRPNYYTHMTQEKFRILTDISAIYKWLTPILFFFSVISTLLLFIRETVKKQYSTQVWLLLVVLGGLISLVSVLTFVKITLWPITRPLFSAYPLVLLYISIAGMTVQRVWEKKRQIAPY